MEGEPSAFRLGVDGLDPRFVEDHWDALPNLDRLRRRLPFFIIASVLLFLAMISRFTADLAPRARAMHIGGAAVCWLLGTLVWSIKVLPKVAVADPTES